MNTTLNKDNPWVIERPTKNPWPGLSYYKKEEVGLPFCGRIREAQELENLINNNYCLTFYGKSGIGKTSLLNAGVFPMLKECNSVPMRIRLSEDAKEISYQKCIYNKVKDALQISEDFFSSVQEETSGHFLWNLFTRPEISGSPKRPIVVLDQLEEIFRLRHREKQAKNGLHYYEDAEDLLTQIYQMISNAVFSDTMLNCRFVLSIREDDLYLLEDCIDNNLLFDLKNCRYRLRPLMYESAVEVVTIPGSGLYERGREEDTAKKIITFAKEDDGSVSTILLSFICWRLYQKSQGGYITMELVEKYCTDKSKQTLFEDYYDESISHLKEPTKVSTFIEDKLVAGGRRITSSLPENISDEDKNSLLKGDHQFLLENEGKVELIHDAFCETVEKRKEQRKIEEDFKSQQDKERLEFENQENKYKIEIEKQRKKILFMLIIVLFGIIFFLCYQFLVESHSNRASNITEQADAYLNEGKINSLQLAQMGVIEALNLAYLPKAEAILRNAEAYDNPILCYDNNALFFANFSPDSIKKRILTGGPNGSMRIWDANSGECLQTIKGFNISTASYSPDGSRIAAIIGNRWSWDSNAFDEGKNIIIFDAVKGIPVDTLIGHTGQVSDICFSQDGTTIASTAYVDSLGAVRVWNSYGEELFKIKGDFHLVRIPLINKEKKNNHNSRALALSPNGSHLLTQFENNIDIWNISEQRIENRIPTNADCVSFSPDGCHILMSNDTTISVWNSTTATCEYTFTKAQFNNVPSRSISFNHKGDKAVEATANAVIIWDIAQQYVVQSKRGLPTIIDALQTLNQPTTVYNASFSPDDKHVIVTLGDGTVSLWNLATNRLSRNTNIGNYGMLSYTAVFPDGNTVLTPGDTMNTTTILKVDGNDVVCTINNIDVYNNCLSPNGQYIAGVEEARNQNGKLKLWDVQTGDSVKMIESEVRKYEHLTFSPNSKILAASINDSIIGTWNVDTGKLIQKMKIYKNEKGWRNAIDISCLAVNDDCVCAFSILNSCETIYMADINRDSCSVDMLKSKIGHDKGISHLIFTRDGKKLLSASEDERLKLWNTNDFSCIKTFKGHTSTISSIGFNTNEQLIISGAYNGEIKVWDAVNGICLCNYNDHASIKAAAFSNDGHRIISITDSGIITQRLWKSLKELIADIRLKFNKRKLTKEEKKDLHID